MEKDKKNNNIDENKQNKIPALLYLSLGVIIYFSGRQKNTQYITIETAIGILLLIIGAIKIGIFFIKRARNPKVQEEVVESKKSKNNKKLRNKR